MGKAPRAKRSGLGLVGLGLVGLASGCSFFNEKLAGEDTAMPPGDPAAETAAIDLEQQPPEAASSAADQTPLTEAPLAESGGAIAPSGSPDQAQQFTLATEPSGLSTDPLDAFPRDMTYVRQPVELVDEATDAPSFYAFRAELQQAIANRDAAFVEAIIPADIQLSFGPTLTPTDLNWDDPTAIAWQKLERAIAPGCTQEIFDPLAELRTWVCPHVFLSPIRLAVADPSSEVFILEDSVSVRATPSDDGLVIDTLSREIVLANLDTIRSLTPQQREQMETFGGWWPVITPAGQQGYVSSRHAYSPLGYRAFFEQQDGDWQITLFATGD